MAINVPSAARELGPLWELQLKQLAKKGQRWNQVADTIRGFGDIADAYQKSKDNRLTMEEKEGRIADAKAKRKRESDEQTAWDLVAVDPKGLEAAGITGLDGKALPGDVARIIMRSPGMRSIVDTAILLKDAQYKSEKRLGGDILSSIFFNPSGVDEESEDERFTTEFLRRGPAAVGQAGELELKFFTEASPSRTSN